MLATIGRDLLPTLAPPQLYHVRAGGALRMRPWYKDKNSPSKSFRSAVGSVVSLLLDVNWIS